MGKFYHQTRDHMSADLDSLQLIRYNFPIILFPIEPCSSPYGNGNSIGSSKLVSPSDPSAPFISKLFSIFSFSLANL
jgi:hypothetical protein